MIESGFQIRPLTEEDIPGVVELQRLAFPPPFPEELHWQAHHLTAHLRVFPEGQFVAEMNKRIVGSCSNVLISEECWLQHGSWLDTVGGPSLEGHDPGGTTLYGIDITVSPNSRRLGIGRAFYHKRFEMVRVYKLRRFGTACRIPDYVSHTTQKHNMSKQDYVRQVSLGQLNDRILTALLKYDLKFIDVVEDYMEDVESGNAAALLEWKP